MARLTNKTRRKTLPPGSPRRMAFRILMALVLAALGAGCQHGPPRESGRFREADLVEVVKLDPSIRLDIRYATTNNFLHRPVYLQSMAFLQRPAAEALLRAQR